ncbi:MAG: cell envelope biogenesis protein OmpA [Alphaproteobacteria bacterium HGW-Alphaproteobacteria-13]|jgi:OOP family OmpA-OmpF porin|nr:MAG: cell envelope biogenesis protein OmpA [Alphaproteobacteria bacterium HGW-Alphaproteobacteria-13]
MIRTIFAAAAALLLAACQSLPSPPPPSGFNAAQTAMLQSQGFVETELGWELALLDRLLFPSSESAIRPDQAARLMGLARNLLSVGIDGARVEGHADSTGSAAANLALSQARAQTVADALQAGGLRFAPGQIVGRGETMPLSDNATPEGRQDNRRVVLIVTPP